MTDHACPRCRRGTPTPLTREQLIRLFGACLAPDDLDQGIVFEQLADLVVALTRHCAECVDAFLAASDLFRVQYRELVAAGANPEEAQLVTTEKVGRVRRCMLVPYAFEGISTWLQRLDRFAQVVERTKGAR